MKEFKIGIATVNYDENGYPISQSFVPGTNVNPDDELLNQLKQIPVTDNSEVTKENADMILAGWWAKMNEIELADREEYKIYSNVINCVKYPNDLIKECSIEYIYKKREEI